MTDLTEACKGECKGHPFNCYNHPTDCGCAASIGEDDKAMAQEWLDRSSPDDDVKELAALLSRVREDEREKCAAVIDEWAKYYGTDLFAPIPPEKRAKDGVFADVLREMMPKFSAAIRTLGK